MGVVGWPPLVVLTAWLVVRTLWWRLTPLLVTIDVAAVTVALIGWGEVGPVPPIARKFSPVSGRH